MLTTAREINVFVTGPQDPVSWEGEKNYSGKKIIYKTKVCILRFQIIMNRQNLTSVFTKAYVQRCTFLHIYTYLILTETHIQIHAK